MHNTQLSDTSALRLAAAVNHHDGFTETRDGSKALDSRGDASFRARYLKDIGLDTTVLFTADYSKEDDSGVAHLPVGRATSGDKNQYYLNPGQDGFYNLKSGGLTLEVNSDLGVGTLTSLTGYRSTSVNGNQLFGDQGGNYAVETWHHKQFSQELRLASTGKSDLQWVTGLFYFTETTDTTPVVTVVTPPLLLNWDLTAKANSAAAFAQGTYSLQPNLRVVGGLRYTHDHKEREGTFTLVNVFSQPYNASVGYSKTSWKAGVEYDLPDKTLLYASVATGYKAGGFNDGNPQTQSALYYNPENLTAYEVGLKGRFLANKLYLSTSAFYYDYKDLQLSSLPPTGGIATLNAAKATVKGIEAEGNWRVTEADVLDLSFSYLKARYDEYLPQGAAGPSYAGQSLDRSPKGSARLAYSRDFNTSVGKVTAGIATKYSTAYVVSDFNIPTQYAQESFWRTDIHLTYAPNNTWYAQLYGRNLENKRQLAINQFGTFTITDPRQFGIRGLYRF
jgi:iron complex outermembrane recepter protein